MSITAYLFLLINIITFLAYGLDKLKAVKNWWRIPEWVLIGLAVIGGSLGAFLGMVVFRHKTRKLKFRFGIPFIVLVQALAVAYLVVR